MNLIVSVDENWAIGTNNKLLYNFKGDIKNFEKTTLNNVVVMGHKTLDFLHKGQPLKERINICLSNNLKFEKKDINVVYSLKELFEKLAFYDAENIFVIGGVSVYKQLLPFCKKAYVTKINAKKPADKFFPNLDNISNWKLTQTSDPLFEKNIVYYFCTYENFNVQKFNYGYEEEIKI